MYFQIRQISVYRYWENQKIQVAIYVRALHSGAHTLIVSESIARRPIRTEARQSSIYPCRMLREGQEEIKRGKQGFQVHQLY